LVGLTQHNLFVLSASISYYSAVAIAPFLLIVLSAAGYLGGNLQQKLITQASSFSSELGQMVEIIFSNVNEGIDIGSVTGLLGLFILFITASLVFLQLRFALDVIHGYHEVRGKRSVWESILEKIFALFVVFMAGIFLLLSSSLPALFNLILPGHLQKVSVFCLNIFIFVVMFWCIHYFTPTRRPEKREALKMSLLSSLFFILGNFVLGVYFRNVAITSIYGAAGSLFVFLVWSYYSAFTLFLSAEICIFLKRNKFLK
jgi:membrane protein